MGQPNQPKQHYRDYAEERNKLGRGSICSKDDNGNEREKNKGTIMMI